MLLYFIISFLLGIFLGDLILNDDYLKIFIIILGLILFYLNLKAQYYKVFLIILLGILFGISRLLLSFESGENHISNFEGQISLKGCIKNEVDVRNDKVKYTISSEFIERGSKWQQVDGKVLVTANRYPVYEYGDCLYISGKIEMPGLIDDFAYDKYLARYGISSVMYRASISKIAENKGNFIFKWIFILKNDFESKLSEIFAEPHASFMAGLILGSRKGIPDHLMEDFNTTGLTHIIAISGYNITLVIVIIGGMFSFLSRKRKVAASIIFIIVFVILVGASAAVVRAGIMGAISLMAIWFGRQYYVGISLFASAFFMNLWNPKILVYDVGFQLSFLATCGLIYISPLLEKYFRFLPETFAIRESATMTISAQVLALPIIILNFGRLSMISPVANIIVLPFIPLAMIFGFFAVLASYIWSFLGNIFGFIGYLLLEFMILFVKLFASIKFASIDIFWFSWWILGIYYFFVLRWLRRKKIDLL